jgi:quaternary ammonium compound-resistance protein SugE
MTPTTAWIYLFIAGLLEIGWAIGLKYTHGFSKLLPSVLTGLAMAGSFYFLSVAVKSLPISTSYAVWVGIGAVGTAIFGMAVLGESASVQKLFFLALLVAGIVGLKFSS